MPKEVKAKGERKKRAKKGNIPQPPFRYKCANTVIDPNAPKRGLSAYMFFAQVCIRPLHLCCIINYLRLGVLTLCYRRTVIQSGTRIPISPSVCHSIPTPIMFYHASSNIQVKLAKSWVNVGRTWPTKTNNNTKPKQPKTRNVTKRKREHIMYPPPSYVADTLVGLNYGCSYARKSIKTSLFLWLSFPFFSPLVNLRWTASGSSCWLCLFIFFSLFFFTFALYVYGWWKGLSGEGGLLG